MVEVNRLLDAALQDIRVVGNIAEHKRADEGEITLFYFFFFFIVLFISLQVSPYPDSAPRPARPSVCRSASHPNPFPASAPWPACAL